MSKKFTILATSDVHGYVEPYLYSEQKDIAIGLAKVNTLFKQLKDENTILIDNGDCIQGSPQTFYFNLNYKGKEVHPMSKILKLMNYDYMNLGNHDFNESIPVLKRHMEECGVPCICCNIKMDGQPISKPYEIHEFPNGARIALFGVVTQHIPYWEKAENLVGVEIEDAYDCAKRTVEMIRANEEVDAVVGVYHGGFEKDLDTGVNTENQTGENWGYRMCSTIEGLDILITGHQHRSLGQYCCNTLVSQTANNAKEIAKLVYDCETKKGYVELLKPDCEPDVEIMDAVKELEAEVQTWLDKPLGETEKDLLIKDRFDARLHKHPIVSFMNQVQFAQYDADFSAVALFNDAAGFEKQITMRDIVSTYVYANTLSVIKMSGHTVKAFLEKCAEYFTVDNDKIVVNPRFEAPKPAHYNYDMVDGLEYTIKVSNPEGSRVISMTRNGEPLDLDKDYTILLSNYRAGGGGEFDMVKDGEVVKDIQKDMVECIADYILANPNIQIDHKDNITVII